MVRIYISLGSNIDPQINLSIAVKALRAKFAGVQLSPVYQSPALGMVADDFLNAAAVAETTLSAHNVTRVLRTIEDATGRDRSQPRFSSRTLDLDLLLYDELISSGELELPRGEISRYAFVLQPLADIAQSVCHPVNGLTIGAMLVALKQQHAEQFSELHRVDNTFLQSLE